ncbi:hypothetical protein N9N28_06440 [Rubripirellula amarantea]|nr:hypothetical protein [Rubripirellula amarantea]
MIAFVVAIAMPRVGIGQDGKSLFPIELERWQKSEPELARGLVEADRLRLKLLLPGNDGVCCATRICQVISSLQQQCRATAFPGKSIATFEVTPERLLGQLRGEQSIDKAAFDAFSGKWFGNWDGSDVNHDWRPALSFAPPRVLGEGTLAIKSLQYAWIGNGFGWNYVACEKSDPSRHYVLGMVYYFAGPNYRDIVSEAAHVGFVDGPSRLVWMTESSVYLEEAFVDEGCSPHYVITALRHDLLGSEMKVLPDVVQATYTRDSGTRPAFLKFSWKPDRLP